MPTNSELNVPTVPLTRRELRERAARAASTSATSEAAPQTPSATEIPPAPDSVIADQEDAFEAASKLFATGENAVITDPADKRDDAEEASSADAAEEEAPEYFGTQPRSFRSNFQRLTSTTGLSVAVMGIVGALAISMALPAFQFNPANAAQSTSNATVDSGPIQAFVASSQVEDVPMERSDNFSFASISDIALEQGIIHTSDDVFTNNRDAAIQWPFVVGVPMSSEYGPRWGRLHAGIDLTPGEGAAIQSIADGTVRIATESGGGYGVTVYIDHEIDGQIVTSHYSHMLYGSLKVVEGQKVKVGDIIGNVGNTGNSYGAHLHFEILIDGVTVDPLPWMREHAG